MRFALDPKISLASRADLATADRCRKLNDEFRLALDGGKVVLSRSVAALEQEARNEVLWAVRLFCDFTPEDDPHEEHDFGAVVCRTVRYVWKIDCCDLDLRYAAPDPGDPAFTIRVLTIMRGDEYRGRGC